MSRRKEPIVFVDVTMRGLAWRRAAVELLSAAHASGLALRVVHDEEEGDLTTARVYVRPNDVMEEGEPKRLELELRRQFNNEEARMWRRERNRK